MRRRSVASIALAGLAVVALAVAGAALPADRVLVVEDAATGDRLVTVPVDVGTPVALEYTHSVERSRVLDAYAVSGDRLVMTRTEFESTGWGLPADATARIEGGRFVATPSWSGTDLLVAPGRIAGHRLHVGNRSYDLVSLSSGRTVRIHVDRRSGFAAAIHALP